MDKKKLDAIYYMTCNDEMINDESLLKRGFSNEDINFLLEEERLYVYSDDQYAIGYMGDLLDFAKERLKDHMYFISDKAIDICYEMAPNDFEVLTLKFKKSFMKEGKTNKFDESIEFLRKMESVADKNEIKDVNCYIFLLSMLTELPDDLRLSAKYLKLHDVTLNNQDNRFDNIDDRNLIRKDIFYQRYSNALRDFKHMSDTKLSNYAYDFTMIKLTERVTSKRKKQAAVVVELAKNDREDEIIILYEEEEKRRILTRHEEYVIKLAEKLSSIRKTGVIPLRKSCPDSRFYDMIDNNDFGTALDRVVEMGGNKTLPLSSSSSYVLLTKIVEEINNAKEKQHIKRKK